MVNRVLFSVNTAVRGLNMLAKNPEYAEVFSQAMSSYSGAQTAWVLDALGQYDFSKMQLSYYHVRV